MATTVHLEHAHAKLTRSLHVVGRRSDGYHLLRSEMVSLDLCDDVEIAEGEAGLSIEDEIAWEPIGGTPVQLDVPSDHRNLVLGALARIGKLARIRLVKRIPPGAGLGGGSSDAAAVLRAFGSLDVELAASLGADVPFCLLGGRALVTGIGDEL